MDGWAPSARGAQRDWGWLSGTAVSPPAGLPADGTPPAKGAGVQTRLLLLLQPATHKEQLAHDGVRPPPLLIRRQTFVQLRGHVKVISVHLAGRWNFLGSPVLSIARFTVHGLYGLHVTLTRFVFCWSESCVPRHPNRASETSRSALRARISWNLG